MATFWRESHFRGNSWISGHWVTRHDFDKSSSINSSVQNNMYPYLSIETYESFIIPNIKCKCCGDEIYFYQTPYGGKIFFNELGHPWEKHCCEAKCCAKEKENIPYDVLHGNRISKVANNKPLWEINGWTPAIFIKSMTDYNEYSFFTQRSLSLNIKESLAINFRIIDNSFYEISFYSDTQYLLVANKEPNFNDLKEFLDIKDSLKLLKRDNIKNIELAKVFFKFLNTHNNYKNDKELIYQLILNHHNSIKSGMLEVYSKIHQQGMEVFEENFLNNFELYNPVIIHTLLTVSVEQTLLLNRIQKIILDKWKKKGWAPYYYKKNSNCDTSIKKIVLVSIEENKEYTYFIQKKYFGIALKKGMLIFVKLINEKFFQILFYDDSSSKEYKAILGKYPSNYELEVFIFIQNSLELIKTENIENIELVKIFFRVLNISDVYKNEKEQLLHFVINHESSKQSGMFDIYQYINKFGIKIFEENLFKKFQFYDEKIINILFSINDIFTIDNITKIILGKREKKRKPKNIESNLSVKYKNNKLNSKKYKQRKSILNKKQDKVNLNSQKHNIKDEKVYASYVKNKEQSIEPIPNIKRDKTNLMMCYPYFRQIS